MFIQCSDCDYKYLVNSADLKPDGRMVECANCNHRWFQEPLKGEETLSSSVRKNSKKEQYENTNNKQSEEEPAPKEIKNLPSTVVKEKKVSLVNTFLVIFLIVFLFFLFWIFKSYGANIFVLVKFFINEFFFNLKLIIDDLAKIVFNILN